MSIVNTSPLSLKITKEKKLRTLSCFAVSSLIKSNINLALFVAIFGLASAPFDFLPSGESIKLVLCLNGEGATSDGFLYFVESESKDLILTGWWVEGDGWGVGADGEKGTENVKGEVGVELKGAAFLGVDVEADPKPLRASSMISSSSLSCSSFSPSSTRLRFPGLSVPAEGSSVSFLSTPKNDRPTAGLLLGDAPAPGPR